jgi:hypothetical protein
MVNHIWLIFKQISTYKNFKYIFIIHIYIKEIGGWCGGPVAYLKGDRHTITLIHFIITNKS